MHDQRKPHQTHKIIYSTIVRMKVQMLKKGMLRLQKGASYCCDVYICHNGFRYRLVCFIRSQYSSLDFDFIAKPHTIDCASRAIYCGHVRYLITNIRYSFTHSSGIVSAFAANHLLLELSTLSICVGSLWEVVWGIGRAIVG